MMADNSETGSSGDVPVSPSTPSGSKSMSLDITSLLQLACNDLGNGDLIHGKDFALSATMSALKDKDQKLHQDFVSTNYSVDEAIRDGAAPVPLSSDRTIDTQRVIDVMDHLLICEATWHEEASFCQTVSSCIYLWRIDRLSSHALLHSFCRSIIVTCNAINSAISSACTAQEDHRNSYYGSSKGDGDDKCLSVLQTVEETIIRKLKACTAPLSKKNDFKDVEPLQTNPNLEKGFCEAVLCRLRFRKHFYRMLTSMRRSQGKGLDLAKKHIDFCLIELDSMLKSEEFLKSLCTVLEGGLSEHKTTASGCQPIGFNSPVNSTTIAPTAINRAFAALTRPRALKPLSWKKAVNYFQKLLHDLSVICSNSLCPVLEDPVRFVVDFHKFQPGCVARAQIQLLLVQDGRLYGREPIFATICKAARLPEKAKNHDIQKHKTIAELGKILIHLLKVLCTSFDVQRSSLAKTLLDWELIHSKLVSDFTGEFGDLPRPLIDENIFTVKICSHILLWVRAQKNWIALRFVLLGFDLELYTPTEYCMVYWYICILLIALVQSKMPNVFPENNDDAVASRSDGVASCSYDADYSSVTQKIKKRRELVNETNMEDREVLLLLCYTYLVQGLITMLGILRNDYKAFQCVGHFNSEEERFVQHFKPLQEAYSRDVSYSDFKEAIDKFRLSNRPRCDSFKTAQKLARELRVDFAKDHNRLAELNQIEEVAKRNGVVLNQIRRSRTLDPSLKFSFEFDHLPHFAVATLK